MKEFKLLLMLSSKEHSMKAITLWATQLEWNKEKIDALSDWDSDK